jgi:thiamine-phosphate pyrophosphorylase
LLFDDESDHITTSKVQSPKSKIQNGSIPRIYPITDTRVSGLSHLEQVKLLVDGGASFIQLREKVATSREFYAAAVECIAFARPLGVKIIINDRVDIALVTGADGVHLGQDDMPPEAARRVLGDKAIIGYSTHSVEQAIGAADMPVDYIAIGPVFGTTTKENPDPVVGLEGLAAVRSAIGDMPLVAIGGITEANISNVIAAGATSAAMISGLWAATYGLTSALRRL